MTVAVQVIIAIVGVLGGAAGVRLIDQMLKIYTTHNDVVTKRRKDQVDSLRDEYDRLLNDVRRDLNASRTDTHNQLQALDGQLRQSREAHARCEDRLAWVEGQLRYWQLIAEQTRSGLPVVGMLQGLLGFITADGDKRIDSITPGVTILLHWEARDLIGKSVERLVPPDYLPRFRTAWERAKIERSARPDREFAVHALSREKDLVPVLVRVGAWRKLEGGWLFWAIISERREEQGDDPEAQKSVTVSAPPGSVVEAKVVTDGAKPAGGDCP